MLGVYSGIRAMEKKGASIRSLSTYQCRYSDRFGRASVAHVPDSAWATLIAHAWPAGRLATDTLQSVGPLRSLRGSVMAIIHSSPKGKPLGRGIIRLDRDKLGLSAATFVLVLGATHLPALATASLGFVIWSACYPLKKAERALRSGKISHETVVSVTFFFGVVYGYYLPVALGGLFYQTGRRLTYLAEKNSKQTLMAVYDSLPQEAWMVVAGAEVSVALDQIQEDHIVVVSIGDVIPVDGIVCEGEAGVDQRALTGESLPVEKGIGMNVYAGTLVLSGRIYIKVTRAGKDTAIAKIDDILKQTIQFKTMTQLSGERLANAIAAPLLLAAGTTGVLLGSYGLLVVLNSSVGNFTTAMGSIANLTFLNRAAKAGIMVKDGRGLEALRTIDTVLFDKTGTLTNDVPAIARIISLDGDYAEETLLRLAASAEQRLSHPIARSLRSAAEQRQIELEDIVEEDYCLGMGIGVQVGKRRVEIGSDRFMAARQIDLPLSIDAVLKDARRDGHSTVLMAVNGMLVGVFEFVATVRPEVPEMLARLRKIGVKSFGIVSGDNREPTKALAEQLGIEAYYYEVLPERKAEIVRLLQAESRKVCFVGDGINDAIAMSQADASISLKGASSIATDAAQIVLMDGSLRNLVSSFVISRQFDRGLRWNLSLMLAPVWLNVFSVYTVGIGVVTAILIKKAAFLIGLGNTVLPTLCGKEERRLVVWNGRSQSNSDLAPRVVTKSQQR